MRKAFAFYFLVQIYASGSLTPDIRNDNVNNNEALQSHILSFSLDFAAKLYTLRKLTKHMRYFFPPKCPTVTPTTTRSRADECVTHPRDECMSHTDLRHKPHNAVRCGTLWQNSAMFRKNATFAIYEGTVLYRCGAFVLLGGR